MHSTERRVSARSLAMLAAAGATLVLAHSPSQAGGAITTFKVKNCTSERVFVCSFDKTDSSMKIPYEAKGIKPSVKKEFGCASLKRCKVIIGVSRKKPKKTVSLQVEAALTAGSVVAASVAGFSAAGAVGTSAGVAALAAETLNPIAAAAAGASTMATLTAVGTTAAVIAVAAGGAVAALEIKDGWSDGEICNQVKKAAQKANLKPKHYLNNNKTYTIVAQYAVNKDGKPYVNPDGTAAFAYVTKSGDTCPAPLKAQLVN